MRLLLLILLATSLHAQEFMTTVVKKKPVAASSGITFNATSRDSTNGATSLTSTVNVSSGSNMRAFIAVGRGVATIDSVKNTTTGVACRLLASNGSAAQVAVSLWSDSTVQAGNNTYGVYISASTYISIVTIVLNGVSTSDAIGTTYSSSTVNDSIAVAVSNSSGQWIVSTVGSGTSSWLPYLSTTLRNRVTGGTMGLAAGTDATVVASIGYYTVASETARFAAAVVKPQ